MDKALISTKRILAPRERERRFKALMEGTAKQQLFSYGVRSFQRQGFSRHCLPPQLLRVRPGCEHGRLGSLVRLELPRIARGYQISVKVCAFGRRRAYSQTGTYVLLEPGKSEVFVSEEELKDRLKFWLENWPGNTLPPDLARFETIDDTVYHLVKSVCELEIDGDVGTIQWYEVRLE